MKTLFLAAAACAVLGTICGADTAPAKLEVHEWGTFTFVSGSDGVPVRWYLPQQSVAELPSFVQHNVTVFGKTGTGTFQGSPGDTPLFAGNGASAGGDLVRMETPVLYFYPEAPMKVTVEAEYRAGRLTEWYPAPVESTPQGIANLVSKTKWTGELVAPDDAHAAEEIPKLESSRGAHYGHAREVPGAWYFHSTMLSPAASGWEKFIFYRGAREMPRCRFKPTHWSRGD